MLRRKSTCFFCLLIFIAVYSATWNLSAEKQEIRQGRKPLNLTYIANEGVMIESESYKVLIDALFEKPNSAYSAPSKEILHKMETGEPPFDNIDVVLITHNHPDHVSLECVDRFLRNHNEAVLVSPKDIAVELEAKAATWNKIRERVRAVDIGVNSFKDVTINGFELRAYRTLHSGNLENPWNFMYLVSIDGWVIFHEGDSDGKMETYQHLRFQDMEIDLALVHFWFPLHPVGSDFLQKVVKPHHIGLIHLPLELYEDAPTKIDMIRQYYGDIFLLKESMETRTIR